jgi:hypothetical protein
MLVFVFSAATRSIWLRYLSFLHSLWLSAVQVRLAVVISNSGGRFITNRFDVDGYRVAGSADKAPACDDFFKTYRVFGRAHVVKVNKATDIPFILLIDLFAA